MSSATHPGRVERALRLGILVYVAVLVALPLAGLVFFGMSGGLANFWDSVSTPVARAALMLTVWTALLVGGINTVAGTATAWVLVRYPLPGRSLLSALVDLPLAVPTLVAGVMLAILYGPTSMVGERLRVAGFEVVFARPGIVLALLLVTLPFVVRAVEPVLAEVDRAEEEAAITLGAGPLATFRTVFLPAIRPAALSGGVRSFGRAIGEFGSIVVVAGNVPFETLTAPIFVFSEIESGESRSAAAVSTVLLFFSLLVHVVGRTLDRRTGARDAG